jgi:hypothetical protein
MIGWTVDGQEIRLFPHQEAIVKALLNGDAVTVYFGGRGWGRATILATAAHYERVYRQAGRPFPWSEEEAEEARAIVEGIRGSVNYLVTEGNPYHTARYWDNHEPSEAALKAVFADMLPPPDPE